MRQLILLFLLLAFAGAVVLGFFSTSEVDLVDPEMSPNEQVMQGFRILNQTSRYASQYVGDQVSCNNCHFNGGNTLGGRNNGISLVGVTQKYETKERLITRINSCFEKSMNGTSPPPDSPEMQSILAYFEWISSPVADSKTRPWLGLQPLKIKYAGSPEAGRPLYGKYCASCHGAQGEGVADEEGNHIPPLWGPKSFNQEAGMARLNTFAAFTYWNMPFGQPTLTEKQAIDIAAFVTTQPR